MSTATQTQHPWRATVRTIFAAVVSLAAIWGLVVEAAGFDETNAIVAATIVVTGAITRVMAIPQVENFLEEHFPWLAAEPKPE